jgi:trans-2,3-dihydro-3-hydroxyanthranilate isomerase
MRSSRVLRVFTRDEVGGNHLGVVSDVEGLDTAAMQQIAAELGFSETIFLYEQSSGVPMVRIFTPAAEMPFAGHPLVGAAWTIGVDEGRDIDRVECVVGEIPFRTEGDRVWVDTPMVTEVEAASDGPQIASDTRLPTTGRTWWARMPLPYLVIEAPSAEAVASANPDFGALLAGPAGEAVYLFFREGTKVKARFFAAGLGVPEDPATGSAASALAAVLAFEGETEGRLSIDQGDEIGHPSTIELSWNPDAASIGGTVRADGEQWLET